MEEWVPNVEFDSRWDDESGSDDIESDDEEDFLDKIEEERPGVDPRRYRNKGLSVALMRMAINVRDDLMDEDWVPKETKKKLRKERKSIHFGNFLNKMFLFFYIQIAVPKNGQKGLMLGVNHAPPSTDIRNCLRIKKGLKILDGRRLLSQNCIHQMMTRRIILKILFKFARKPLLPHN